MRTRFKGGPAASFRGRHKRVRDSNAAPHSDDVRTGSTAAGADGQSEHVSRGAAASRVGSARTLAGCLSIFGQSAFAAALIQCYATRTGDGCVQLSVHATMAECRKLASEYQKFDTRDLRVKGVPAVVSYHCVAVRVTVSARGGKRSFR